jgi:hypothetical protein
MPDNGPSSKDLPKGQTFMWIEPNHPIQPPAQAPPPAKKEPLPNYSKKDRTVRT